MRANRTPRAVRLRRRIARLIDQEAACWVRIGGGNPYQKCRHCGVTNVQETYEGHRKHCPIRGVAGQIAHYRTLLETSE